jgi:ABC-2 type transport system permease protein
MSAEGVIHDIGYQRYEGPRLPRSYSVRSLYSHGFRTAFGLGRSGKAKVFPWICVGILMLVATILTVIRSQSGKAVLAYWEFPQAISLIVILFCAVVGPELVSRDLRGGVLPLYFSRPLTRTDYAFAKLGALMSTVFVLLAAPMTLMFVGAAFSVANLSAFWHELGEFGKGLAVAGVYAVLFAALALLVASLAGRRAVAAAMIVALFLITTPVYGVLMGIAYSGDEDGQLTGGALTLSQLAGLVSPTTLAQGVGQWWFAAPVGADGDGLPGLGSYGVLYGLVALGIVLVSSLLLLLRYRKVAR